jgi:feruloyl esterase
MTVTGEGADRGVLRHGSPLLVLQRFVRAAGKQGLKEAQRFPADYDGIIAGAPGADWTGRAAQSMRIAQAMHKDATSYIPPSKYPVIHKAVVDKCDALDGIKDGVLDNPKACKFDPGVLACTGNDESSCLTPPQVASARQVYATMTNPKTKREIPGLEPGSELGWATWGGPQPLGLGADHFKYVVYKDPNWDYLTFNFDRDIVRAEEIDNGLINALDPNLKPFFDRGGKLIQYHGWSDPQIAPGNAVQYYSRVADTLGGASKIDPSYRLFMLPGMAHCRGGEGP